MKKLKTYHVMWEIEVDANSPKQAALEALRVQQDRGSSATVFDVWLKGGREGSRVDLDCDTVEPIKV